VLAGSFQFRKIRRQVPALRGAEDEARTVERLLIRAVDEEGGVAFGEIAPWDGFPIESLAESEAALMSAQGSLDNLLALGRAGALPCLAAACSMLGRWPTIAGFAGALPCAGLLGEYDGERQAAELAAAGFGCLKAKVRPGEGLSRARALLAATPGEVSLRLDANGRLGLEAALELVDWARGEARVEFIEQPLAPGDPGYAVLGPSKVALDESFAGGGRDAPEARDWQGHLVVKPAMAGDWDGLRSRLEPIDPDRLVVSSAFETAVGFQAALALASELGVTRAAGFGTLGWDATWERHAAGAFVSGRPDIDWEAFWAQVT
jgi:o-succinylbenzoate synthase